MRKILYIILFLIPIFAFSDTEALQDCSQALNDSNELLEKAFEKIEELGKENRSLKEQLKTESEESGEVEESREIEALKKENENLKASLAKASNSLRESNIILEKAYERIAKDQKEIDELRKRIEELIDAGVEVKTYNWSVSALAGYPYEIGFNVNYNLHWMPNIGIILGSSYDIENEMPKIKAGLRINIDQ